MNKLNKAYTVWQVLAVTFVATLATASIVAATTTIGSNISTDGTLSVAGATAFAGNASTTGSAILKSATINSDTGAISFGNEDLTTTGNIALATASSTGLISVKSLKVSSLGDTVSDVQFGTCLVDIPSVNASSTAVANCTATGVTTAFNVFMNPVSTSSSIIFRSASSTADNTIQVSVYNTGLADGAYNVSVNPDPSTWMWMAIR